MAEQVNLNKGVCVCVTSSTGSSLRSPLKLILHKYPTIVIALSQGALGIGDAGIRVWGARLPLTPLKPEV